MIASASAIERAIGFSTSTAMPRSSSGRATSACEAVGVATTTASTAPARSPGAERLRPVNLRDFLRPLRVDVDDADQLDAFELREDARVMPAEMADANHRGPHAACRHRASAFPRPTIAMPAASAASTTAGPSISSVRPASIDSDRRADFAHDVDGGRADHRHVEAHVLRRLGDLHHADAATRQRAGAPDHLVGAFHRFHRHHRAILHRNRLSHVQARHAVGRAIAELEIGELVVGRRGVA